jgi:hypothetical protein
MPPRPVADGEAVPSIRWCEVSHAAYAGSDIMLETFGTETARAAGKLIE